MKTNRQQPELDRLVERMEREAAPTRRLSAAAYLRARNESTGAQGGVHSGGPALLANRHRVAGDDAGGVAVPVQLRAQILTAQAGGPLDVRAAVGGDAALAPVGEVLRKDAKRPGEISLGAGELYGAVDAVHRRSINGLFACCQQVVSRGTTIPSTGQYGMPFKYPDTASRLAFVMESCGYPKDAAFADALGLRPQNLRNWRDRGKIGRASLERIRHVTGASIDWMVTGIGEPFPDGPIRYEGAPGPSSGLADRVARLEGEIDTLAAVTARLLGVIAQLAPNSMPPLSAEVHRALAATPNPPAFLELLAQSLPPAPAGAGARPSRKR